jgi:hypothetical protein
MSMLEHALELAPEMDSGFEHDIREFKVQFCDETPLIVGALRSNFSDYILDPILDVGAGFQAISIQSFPGHDITLLDKIAYDLPSTREKRVTCDFFDYDPTASDVPKTIIFCHVLQYLDDNLKRLYKKIDALGPERIITVVNDNDGAFGDAVSWARRHMPTANPEVAVPMASIGYKMVKRARITAKLVCPDFETLAYQFGRIILDLPTTTSHSRALRAYLRSLLPSPSININQSIIGYEKQNRS